MRTLPHRTRMCKNIFEGFQAGSSLLVTDKHLNRAQRPDMKHAPALTLGLYHSKMNAFLCSIESCVVPRLQAVPMDKLL